MRSAALGLQRELLCLQCVPGALTVAVTLGFLVPHRQHQVLGAKICVLCELWVQLGSPKKVCDTEEDAGTW